MKSETRESIISYVLVLIGALVIISLVFNNNVWLDEAFTASLIRTDMAGVLERSMADTLPPLYNIILKLITDIFGYKISIMKITSSIPVVLTMLLSATVVRKRHGLLISSLFTLCLMSMPTILYYAVEIRMYSLGFFFATASGIYAYECILDSKYKNWILFTLYSVLAGYSHHFAFVTVGFIYLYLLLYYIVCERSNIKRWFICLLATFVLYFPCLLVTLRQFKSVSGYFSMPEITLKVFIKYCRFPFTVGNTVLSILLSLVIILYLLVTVLNIKKGTNRILHIYSLGCFSVIYGVLIFGTIVSKVMTANIFVDRYLFFSVGLLWLFFSIEAGSFENKSYSYVTACLIITCGIAGYQKEYAIEYTNNASAVIEFLEENTSKGDILYTIEDNEEMAFCLPFYEENLTNIEDLSTAVDLSEENNSTLWLTVIDYSDYDFKELKDYKMLAEFEGSFDFDRYSFEIYKVVPVK